MPSKTSSVSFDLAKLISNVPYCVSKADQLSFISPGVLLRDDVLAVLRAKISLHSEVCPAVVVDHVAFRAPPISKSNVELWFYYIPIRWKYFQEIGGKRRKVKSTHHPSERNHPFICMSLKDSAKTKDLIRISLEHLKKTISFGIVMGYKHEIRVFTSSQRKRVCKVAR
ncbi:hypothetical protein TNCT_662711 [Trichonephila clavata]|uniref:Uncharacterized protein n=1 Tax=Trichonephila clavata TaxID=2740835 RepID=A0A8X6EWG9_TRICU|nr:hypothetical protein TNCT_662711 [Trichonephila clavata]